MFSNPEGVTEDHIGGSALGGPSSRSDLGDWNCQQSTDPGTLEWLLAFGVCLEDALVSERTEGPKLRRACLPPRSNPVRTMLKARREPGQSVEAPCPPAWPLG